MNITDTLSKYAEYNNMANKELILILEPLGTTKLEEPVGSYFKTLGGILNHMATADLVWFPRLKDQGIWPTEELEALEALPKVQYGQKVFGTWEEFKTLRRELDRLWMKVAENFPMEKDNQVVEYTTFQGSLARVPLGGILLHLFNHQTHHRGAISQILDVWNISNDYSGLNKVFLLPI